MSDSKTDETEREDETKAAEAADERDEAAEDRAREAKTADSDSESEAESEAESESDSESESESDEGSDEDEEEDEDADAASEAEKDPEVLEPAKVKGGKSGGGGGILGLLGFLAALGGGFFIGQWLNSRGVDDSIEVEQGPRFNVDLRGDEPQIGPDDALVTIIEFADYQCPYCVQAAGPVKEAAEEYDEDVRFIYKHYPLPGHPKAEPAALAAWAAHQQGKFWELHEWIFEQKADLTGLQQEVESLDLDWAKFKADMNSQEAADAVDNDAFAGGKIGVTGTPTFFVNGHRYNAPKSVKGWRTVIEGELEAAEAIVEAGTPREGVYAKLMEGAIEKRNTGRAAKQQRRPGEPDPSVTYNIPTGDRPSMGPDDALVTFVQFSDFQCPFCQRVAPQIHSLVERHDDVRVVFRNLPLPMHPQAKDAAKAALAAHRQGKFWEMHDKLFEKQDQLASLDYAKVAEELGLDVDQFRADLEDPQLEQMIQEDMQLARQYGVKSTPCGFMNGRFVRGALPRGAFDEAVAEARQRAQAVVDAGTAPADVYAEMMASGATAVADAK